MKFNSREALVKAINAKTDTQEMYCYTKNLYLFKYHDKLGYDLLELIKYCGDLTFRKHTTDNFGRLFWKD